MVSNRSRLRWLAVLCVALCLGLGCRRDRGEAAVEVQLRRLSIHEFDNTLADVLRDDTRPGSRLLPADRYRPFDNAAPTQDPSLVLVEALESIAADAAARLVNDQGRLNDLLPCSPDGPSDAACLEDFARVIGRRLLRRPLDAEHLDRLVEAAQFYAAEERRFETGVEIVVRALLQDPAFLYRVEAGTPFKKAPEVYELDGYEVATRMAFLLWASPPDDALLDSAEAGTLDTPEGVRDQAQRMLADPRARAQIDRFHAMWLGYHQLPHDAWLTTAMRREARALIERVIFDEARPYDELWTSPESYVDPALAEHYGYDPIKGDEPAWVAVPVERAGLLGTGAFLSVGSGVADTSPTRRGKAIRERLFCSPVEPPPPGVAVDEPPDPSLAECKEDRYIQHRNDPACSGCHSLMDPIGFGLETYDREGRRRRHDDGNPECTISGQGEVVPYGPFSGPAELARLALTAQLDACAVDHVLQFALGRELSTADVELSDRLLNAFRAPEQAGRFDRLLLDLVTDPAFRLRREVTP
ncbi:MAG: DUF1592 domain-containing protein [Myxococcota bacterium]